MGITTFGIIRQMGWRIEKVGKIKDEDLVKYEGKPGRFILGRIGGSMGFAHSKYNQIQDRGFVLSWPLKFSAEFLRKWIEGSIEPDEPLLTIVAELKKFDGKQITKRITDALQKALPEYEFRIADDNWKTLKWAKVYGGYSDDYNLGLNLTPSMSNERYLNMAYVLDEGNPSFFRAREARNEKRRNVMASQELLDRMAESMNVYTDARNAVQKLFDADIVEPFHYSLEEMVGLRNDETR